MAVISCRRDACGSVAGNREPDPGLDEITGCGITAAHAIIAEVGLDMIVFGAPGRLVSWARRCPQTRQSGQKNTTGKAGKGNPWLNGILGEIAASASRTDTFLGERCRGRPPLCGVHCDGDAGMEGETWASTAGQGVPRVPAVGR